MQPQSASDQPPAAPASQPVTLEQLVEAVSADTGMPPGRVRRLLLSAERWKAALEQNPDAVHSAGASADSSGGHDPLRWYPVGANGRLRP